MPLCLTRLLCEYVPMEDEEDKPLRTPKEPNPITLELNRVKEAAVNAASKREFIPQPLFWSLFFSELAKVKVEREQIRAIEEALSKLG